MLEVEHLKDDPMWPKCLKSRTSPTCQVGEIMAEGTRAGNVNKLIYEVFPDAKLIGGGQAVLKPVTRRRLKGRRGYPTTGREVRRIG